ncbi:DUF1592 domain-containing protein [Aeoliella sp. SH292]|uniref:DUF1592 domain-containing protein n=1 Tax=Aeoliella sp. SH292 TaxID=3454464 RepID=UPI003F94FED3
MDYLERGALRSSNHHSDGGIAVRPLGKFVALSLIGYLLLGVVPCSCASPPGEDNLGSRWESEIRPLFDKYCLACHGGDSVEGEVDFSRVVDGAGALREESLWQSAEEMLSEQLMPPEGSPQPTEGQREQLGSWLQAYLKYAASARSGDPGRVVLRRLSNAEYTYTIRDLTGIESLDPARHFPADGAAGEGFTNTGNSLVMSPTLLSKYLDAGKEIAEHAVLLPDGFEFSPHKTRRDWTDDLIADIRKVYARYTVPLGKEEMNLAGIEWGSSRGGQIPLANYFAVTLCERKLIEEGRLTIDEAARRHGLSPKYLHLLWDILHTEDLSPLLAELRDAWRDADLADATALQALANTWQQRLWSFSPVGQIGRRDGPEQWLTPVNPVVSELKVQVAIPERTNAKEIILSLVAGDAGDGNENDYVVWQRPRLTAIGRADLLISDLPRVVETSRSIHKRAVLETANCLAALHQISQSADEIDWVQQAERFKVSPSVLRAWAEYLGVRTPGLAKVYDRFVTTETLFGAESRVVGWGRNDTPYIVANPADKETVLPGPMRAHGVAMHPSATQSVAIGWTSPTSAKMRISASVLRELSNFENAVSWSLQLRRGGTRRVLFSETLPTAASKPRAGEVSLIDVPILKGDLISLIVTSDGGHRGCSHCCVELELEDVHGSETWNVANDVAMDIMAGNPHADSKGRPGIWSFYTETEESSKRQLSIPPNSVLARWREAATEKDHQRLAVQVQDLLTRDLPPFCSGADRDLKEQLHSISGPLLGAAIHEVASSSEQASLDRTEKHFGRGPDGQAIGPDNLCVRAPCVLQLAIPAEIAQGSQFEADVILESEIGVEGSVQCHVDIREVAEDITRPTDVPMPAIIEEVSAGENRRVDPLHPILVGESSAARRAVLSSFADFRELFPAAVCYASVVPHDEAISLRLYYRDDARFTQLLLDEGEAQTLDRLWEQLQFVSQGSLSQLTALEQWLESAGEIGVADDFRPLEVTFEKEANALRKQLIDSESLQLTALGDFASRAARRPLTSTESNRINTLYENLRDQGVPHEEAFRLTLAGIFSSPEFLYRIEVPPPGMDSSPVSDWEIATRLSYFLWSAPPDEELRSLAASGKLSDTETLLAQSRRMLVDPKSRRLALEFGCQWLHVRNFDQLDEKSERHFPSFLEHRRDIHEETIQFFTHLIQENQPILDVIDSDYSFANERLALYYGIPNVAGEHWRRVDGVKQFGRGGVLAQASVLATQSGASRTSPILRGTWLSEVILGDRLPKPPPGVPPLPDDIASNNELTVRELVERHVSDSKCAVCHRRIDPYGFALESFDAIGRFRELDESNRAIDDRVAAFDGSEFEGIEGLRRYILTQRRDEFLKQFCRKLLGFALGRSVLLSDQPLLDEMIVNLHENEYRFASAVETIVSSKQFREIRGRDLQDASLTNQKAPTP